MSLKLPSDLARKIAEALQEPQQAIEEIFEFEEDKQGFFVARLKPKKFLDRSQFRTVCALARDLGGEGYLQGAKAWKVPGPCVKKSPSISEPQDVRGKPAETPSGHGAVSEPAYKAPGNQIPTGPSGVTPRSITDDKSTPPQFTVPIKALLSMPFQARSKADDPEFAELVESVRTYGILEPVLVRPRPNGLYETVAGERRVAAAKKAGLIEVPVTIRFLSDEEAFVLQLTENLQRKDLSEEEKTRALGELARRTKWNAQQIADKLKMSYPWVCRYLPKEFKDKEKVEAGKVGGEALAEGYRESQDFALQRRAESQDTRQGIPCARCGDLVSEPVHLDGKFYCDMCAEEVQAEKVPTAFPSEGTKESVTGPVEAPSLAPVIDIGEFECPECHQHFIVEHLPNGKHKLKLVRELEG